MTESITDAFKCNQCGAVYDSEKELRKLQQAAHDAVSSERTAHETSQKKLTNQDAKAKGKNV